MLCYASLCHRPRNFSLSQFVWALKEFSPGGVLDFGLDGGVPPGPRDPNPCLEVKKVPMFRDFAQKMDPCLGIFWKFSGLAASPENFCDFDEKWTHV